MVRASDVGVKVGVGLRNKESVQGWLLGEIPEGLLIALDVDGTEVRLIRDYVSIGYDRDGTRANFSISGAEKFEKNIDELNQSLAEPMRRALRTMKYDSLFRFTERTNELVWHIHHVQFEYGRFPRRDESEIDFVAFFDVHMDEVIEMHSRVWEVFEESGIAALVDNLGPSLARMPPQLVLPAADLAYQGRDELISSLLSSREKGWNTKRHAALLNDAKNLRPQLIAQALSERSVKREKPALEARGTWLQRWGGPALRILTGSGLAVANVSLGLTAGLATSIATIGATTVPVYVGVATSVFTGLVQVADGMEKLGVRK